MMSALRALWRASIWHPDAIGPDEYKYRLLKRVWLPLYDLLAITAGVIAATVGARLLNRLFDDGLVSLFGVTFTLVAIVCLLGVAFPRLWAVEIAGKSLLVGMILAYIAAILLYPSPTPPGATDRPNYFVVAMLAFGLPLALFRLSLLGEEWKERRDDKANDETTEA